MMCMVEAVFFNQAIRWPDLFLIFCYLLVYLKTLNEKTLTRYYPQEEEEEESFVGRNPSMKQSGREDHWETDWERILESSVSNAICYCLVPIYLLNSSRLRMELCGTQKKRNSNRICI